MPKVRVPCVQKHDGYPGLPEMFAPTSIGFLPGDYEIRHADTPDGQITYVVNAALDAALHYHECDVEEA